MEHFGVWKGREVYTLTHAEYVRYEYYKPDTAVAFWILDDDYFVADNKIVGKIVMDGWNKITIDDTVKNAGSRYYYVSSLEVKNVKLVNTRTDEVVMESNVDEILNSVYTSKLWDEV